MLEGPVQPDAAAGDASATIACASLKAPLCAILGFAELLRAGLSDGLPAERMDALAQAIARSGEAALTMIATAEAALSERSETAPTAGGD